MTLHEAIEKLLKQFGRPMTTTEIANELNINKWYQKKDNSDIISYQIHGRTKNYSSIFNRNGTTVSLNGEPNIKPAIPKKTQPKLIEVTTDNSLLENDLMNEKNFRKVNSIDNSVPHQSGLYCIRITNINKLPNPFNEHLENRKHNIIYIGIASQSLYKRFLKQELRAKGHGTFFRSIGSVLGFRPPKGSLISKANKKNYKFSSEDEKKIIAWINENLIVNWISFDGDFEEIETQIIQNHLPLLNIAKNPSALEELSELRAECLRIANN